MTWAPDCPDPWHRLFALVGPGAISQAMDDGAPDIAHAVIVLGLELPCHLHADVVRLLHEAGCCNERALAEPCVALQALAETMLP